MNAKNIDMSAFAGMESLKEIHIRGGVEHMSLGAFAMLPSIETICLEGIDPDVMEDDGKSGEQQSYDSCTGRYFR